VETIALETWAALTDVGSLGVEADRVGVTTTLLALIHIWRRGSKKRWVLNSLQIYYSWFIINSLQIYYSGIVINSLVITAVQEPLRILMVLQY
jgi:hypothetical protein